MGGIAVVGRWVAARYTVTSPGGELLSSVRGPARLSEAALYVSILITTAGAEYCLARREWGSGIAGWHWVIETVREFYDWRLLPAGCICRLAICGSG